MDTAANFIAAVNAILAGQPLAEPGDTGELAGVLQGIRAAYQAGAVDGARSALAEACASYPQVDELVNPGRRNVALLSRMLAGSRPTFVEFPGVTARDMGLIPTSELLKTDFSKPGWAVEDMIPLAELTFLISDGGIGKSWLLLALSETLSWGGTTFLGHAANPCDVLYVDMELDRVWYSNRVKMVDAGLRKQRLIWRDTRPYDVQYLESPMFSFDGAAEFMSRPPVVPGDDTIPTAFDALRNALLVSGARVLIIDPIAELWGEVDENSANETAAVCRALRAIARDTGAAVVIAHHTNKSRTEERGSTAIRNAAAAMYTMTWEHQAGARMRKFETNKNRHGRDAEPVYLDFVWADGALTIEALTSGAIAARVNDIAEAQSEQEVRLVVQLVAGHAPGYYNKTRLLDALQSEESVPRRRAVAAIDSAEARGLVETFDGLRRARLYRLPEVPCE